MVKRVTCKLICVLLIINCFVCANSISAFAVGNNSLTLSYDSMLGFINKLETSLSSHSALERDAMYALGKVYFTSNEDIDNILIALVENSDTEISGVPQSLSDLIESFSAYENAMLFALDFIKSIDTDTTTKRAAAITQFTARTPYSGMNSEQEDALLNVYSKFVSSDFRNTMLADHQINDKVLLNLFSCIKGSFVLTDNKSNTSKLAVKSINSSFSSRLEENVSRHFSTINGISTNSGEGILKAIIDTVNSSETNSMIKNYKLIFAALGMYTPYVETSSNSGTSRPNGTGMLNPNPNPIYQPLPVVIPTPQPAPEVLATIENFTDVKTHWSSPYLAVMASKKIFVGYDDGEFKPDQGITREELAVVLVRALGLETRLEGVEDVSFADNNQIEDWSKKAIALLVEMGIYNGYEDGSFKPKNIISREELASLIARSLTNKVDGALTTFDDNNSIDDWALKGVRTVYYLGIIKGNDDGTFKPKDNATRAEVATMIYNFMATENLL